MPKPWRAEFTCQRFTAKGRGIPFNMSFSTWRAIWKKSGHLHERGKRKGQYQMARKGDKGAYEIGNVEIVTIEENRASQVMTKEHCARIGSKNAKAKLTEKQVLKIRTEFIPHNKHKGLSALGRKYGVSPQVIFSIINRQTWKHC